MDKLKFNIILSRFWAKSKPNTLDSGIDIRTIQKDFKGKESTNIELYAFIEKHCYNGHTVIPAMFKVSESKKDEDFIEKQLFMIDIDNKDKKHYLSKEQALKIPFVRDFGLFGYYTFSNTKEHEHFRLVFCLDKPTQSTKEVDEIYDLLFEIFPYSDTTANQIGRMFYGTRAGYFELNEQGTTSTFTKEELQKAVNTNYQVKYKDKSKDKFEEEVLLDGKGREIKKGKIKPSDKCLIDKLTKKVGPNIFFEDITIKSEGINIEEEDYYAQAEALLQENSERDVQKDPLLEQFEEKRKIENKKKQFDTGDKYFKEDEGFTDEELVKFKEDSGLPKDYRESLVNDFDFKEMDEDLNRIKQQSENETDNNIIKENQTKREDYSSNIPTMESPSAFKNSKPVTNENIDVDKTLTEQNKPVDKEEFKKYKKAMEDKKTKTKDEFTLEELELLELKDKFFFNISWENILNDNSKPFEYFDKNTGARKIIPVQTPEQIDAMKRYQMLEKFLFNECKQSLLNWLSEYESEFKSGQSFKSELDFRKALNQVDIREFLELPPENPFRDIFHEDENPSAFIYPNEETGVYMYFCYSKSRPFTGDIFKLVGEILWLDERKSLKLLLHLTNSTINYNDTDEKGKIEQGLLMFREEILKETKSELEDVRKYFGKNIIHVDNLLELLMCQVYVDSNLDYYYLTFKEVDVLLSDYRTKYKSKISKNYFWGILTYLCTLGILKKETEEGLPEEIVTNYYTEQKESKTELNLRTSNFYMFKKEITLNSFNEIKNITNVLSSNHVRLVELKRGLIWFLFSEQLANKVFPQSSDSNSGKVLHKSGSIYPFMSEKIEERYLDFKTKCLNSIQNKGYYFENEFVDYLMNLPDENKKLGKDSAKASLKECKLYFLILNNIYESKTLSVPLKNKYNIPLSQSNVKIIYEK